MGRWRAARRPPRRGSVLADGQVGHSEHHDAAVTPWLFTSPQHDVVDVAPLLRRQQLRGALGVTTAPQIDIDHDETLGGPPRRIGCLPPGQR
jgi:hypothetical protein